MVSNEKSLDKNISKGKYIGEKLEENYSAFCREKNIEANYNIFLDSVVENKSLAKNKKLRSEVVSYIVNESSLAKDYFGDGSFECVERGGLEAKAGYDIHKVGPSENISDVAGKYGMSVADLARINRGNVLNLNSNCAPVLGKEVYVLSDKISSSPVRGISENVEKEDVSAASVGWFDKYGFVSKAVGVVGSIIVAAGLLAYCGAKSPSVKYDSVTKKMPVAVKNIRIDHKNMSVDAVSSLDGVEKIGDSTYKIIVPKVPAKDRSSWKGDDYKTKAIKTIAPKVPAKDRSALEKSVSKIKTITPKVPAKNRSSWKGDDYFDIVEKDIVSTVGGYAIDGDGNVYTPDSRDANEVSITATSLEDSVEKEFKPSSFHRPRVVVKKTNPSSLESAAGYLSEDNGANFAKYNVSIMTKGDSSYLIADSRDAVSGRLSDNVRAYVHDAVKLDFEGFKKLKSEYGLDSISLGQKLVGLNGFVEGKKSYDLAFVTELRKDSNRKLQENVSKLSISSKFILDKWSKLVNFKNGWSDILRDFNLHRGFGYEVNLVNDSGFGGVGNDSSGDSPGPSPGPGGLGGGPGTGGTG